MKSIKRKKCTYNGCNENVFADGLCYDHYVEELEQERKLEKIKYGPISGTVFFISVVFLVVLWIAIGGSAVEIALNSIRISSSNPIFYIISALIVIVLSYMLIRVFLKCLDNVKIVKYLFFIPMLVAFIALLMYYERIFPVYKDCLRTAAEFYSNLIDGLFL